jgi:hypothetical protein
MIADVIAVPGDPLADITVAEQVRFEHAAAMSSG